MAFAAVAAVSGCGMLSVDVGVPRFRPRVEVNVPVPQPQVEVAYEEPAPQPQPRPQRKPKPAMGMPVMPQMSAPPQFPTGNRDQAWSQFMLNPPIALPAQFLNSRIAIDPQYAAMMGMPATVQFNVQHLLANLVLLASFSPEFRITQWSAGPGPNSYTVAFSSSGEAIQFTFVNDPATGLTRVLMTADGTTVDAWPIVFALGLSRQ